MVEQAQTCIAQCTPFLSCFAFARKFVAGDFRILRRCSAKNMQTKSVLTEETIENIIMLWTFDSVRMSTTMKTDGKEALSAW